jgi:hypothetical protein
MKYLNLFEEFTTPFEMEEKYDEVTLSIGHSFISFFYLKDTYNLVEFTDLDLDNVYETIGEECVYIDKISINLEDKEKYPHLVRRFIEEVERYAKEKDCHTICLIAEPFGSKRKSADELVKMYQHFGFEIFEKIPGKEHYMMYKNI